MDIELSCICPTYNRSELLAHCASVFLDSSPSSWEFIVSDDGSTDSTPDTLAQLTARFGGERIRVTRTEKNFGAPVARNRGLQLARGRYVLFVDSDDILSVDGVRHLLLQIQNDPSADYAYGKVIMCDEMLHPLQGKQPIGEPFSDTPHDIVGYHWHTMAALYRRDFLLRVGDWNERLTGSQDWEYQARVKLAGGARLFSDVVVGYWRQHSGPRVGTLSFRPDYCRSTFLAYETVLDIARLADRCDCHLESRLAKRMALIALEWGANRFPDEKHRCLMKAQQLSSSSRSFKAGIAIADRLPFWADRFLWKILTGRHAN
jgi:glycosyltransferase involved in cell wall biosynthesis